jgi:uncharacterized membrane protein
MEKHILYVLTLAALIFTPAGAFAQNPGGEGVAPNTDLGALKVDTPVIISSNVAFADSGNKWIAMSADVHAITQVPIDKVYAVLHDLENQPKVFNKGLSVTKSVVVKEAGSNGVTATFTTAAAGQDTSYTALITEKVNLPESAFITVKQTVPNDQIRNVYATWYLSAQTINGATYTYIRFYDSNEAAGGSAKKSIVSLGINGAHTATLKQLIDGAKKR